MNISKPIADIHIRAEEGSLRTAAVEAARSHIAVVD